MLTATEAYRRQQAARALLRAATRDELNRAYQDCLRAGVETVTIPRSTYTIDLPLSHARWFRAGIIDALTPAAPESFALDAVADA